MKLKRVIDQVLTDQPDKAEEIQSAISDSKENSTVRSENGEVSATSNHFCKKNRWNSYDCTICKVILPSIGAYEKHAQTEVHERAVEITVNREYANS